jgi:predicted TPR repeat methyltransferase
MDEPPDAPRQLNVDEAVALAMECQRNGQLDEADAFYGAVLKLEPDHPSALHFSGVLAHQRRCGDEAITLIARSLALAPDRPDWHCNLGMVLQERGRLDEAIAAYRQALALDPSHANAHNNLGVLLKAQGRMTEAETAYREAIRCRPNAPDAYHNLAILLGATDRGPEAVECFCKALTLKPKFPEARRLLALAHCVIGEHDKATRVCEEWLIAEPEDPVALHTLASVSGQNVPARASDAYVRKVFDSFAASFEAKLAQLDYRAPQLVAAALLSSGTPREKKFDVLDAGCGTGLCGLILKPYARSLAGVDLSQAMLDLARAKNVYDELVSGELTAFFDGRPNAFDLIVSADTLVYFGALEGMVEAAFRAVRPGGYLIFTVEEMTDDSDPPTYRIKPHGRFNHRAGYVERVLVNAGFNVSMTRADLRKESGLPVSGLVVTASKRN